MSQPVSPVVRFAPSPTGYLHVGNARAALFNWLFARRHGGRFILRFDDTDRLRSKPEYEAAIERDLAWLGLDWDHRERQSERLARYDAARDRLIANGRLYACYETPEELEFKRKRLLAQGRPPVYDRAALRLADTDRTRVESEGRRPHWRFKLAAEEVRWDDLVRGPQHVDEASQSDPVLVRADTSYLYGFTSVVDDIDFAITHVIRGEDHVTNTGAQIQIFRALDDAASWAEIVRGALTPVLEDPDFLTEAATRLPPEPWTGTTWKDWTSALGPATGRKGRALFHPLRLALTGRETGPEMAKFLPLIGRDKTAARLMGQTA